MRFLGPANTVFVSDRRYRKNYLATTLDIQIIAFARSPNYIYTIYVFSVKLQGSILNGNQNTIIACASTWSPAGLRLSRKSDAVGKKAVARHHELIGGLWS